MLASTRERVPENTPQHINERIQFETDRNVAYYSTLDDNAVKKRLDELDQEWDIDRMLEAHTAGLAIGGFLLGAVSNRKWFVLPGLAGCFLLQYALEGWCPQLPVLRRLGFRTAEEIAAERCALLAARKQPSKPK
ncbi:MAG TPA: hypothetical protein VHX65_14830 [Pirellulales bacterium]|jgi:hypothetical protein|nr:hypothetical protein [Pirellulales bacterium]